MVDGVARERRRVSSVTCWVGLRYSRGGASDLQTLMSYSEQDSSRVCGALVRIPQGPVGHASGSGTKFTFKSAHDDEPALGV
jgi:hypothetical protein